MQKIETVADLKRLPVGATLVLVGAVDYDGSDWKHKSLNKPRKIEHKQTNAIRLEGGSWLYYPTASDFKANNDGTFTITTDGKMPLTYQAL